MSEILEVKPEKCFNCEAMLYEIGDHEYGCPHCKAIWSYNGVGWQDIQEKYGNKDRVETN